MKNSQSQYIQNLLKILPNITIQKTTNALDIGISSLETLQTFLNITFGNDKKTKKSIIKKESNICNTSNMVKEGTILFNIYMKYRGMFYKRWYIAPKLQSVDIHIQETQQKQKELASIYLDNGDPGKYTVNVYGYPLLLFPYHSGIRVLPLFYCPISNIDQKQSLSLSSFQINALAVFHLSQKIPFYQWVSLFDTFKKTRSPIHLLQALEKYGLHRLNISCSEQHTLSLLQTSCSAPSASEICLWHTSALFHTKTALIPFSRILSDLCKHIHPSIQSYPDSVLKSMLTCTQNNDLAIKYVGKTGNVTHRCLHRLCTWLVIDHNQTYLWLAHFLKHLIQRKRRILLLLPYTKTTAQLLLRFEYQTLEQLTSSLPEDITQALDFNRSLKTATPHIPLQKNKKPLLILANTYQHFSEKLSQVPIGFFDSCLIFEPCALSPEETLAIICRTANIIAVENSNKLSQYPHALFLPDILSKSINSKDIFVHTIQKETLPNCLAWGNIPKNTIHKHKFFWWHLPESIAHSEKNEPSEYDHVVNFTALIYYLMIQQVYYKRVILFYPEAEFIDTLKFQVSKIPVLSTRLGKQLMLVKSLEEVSESTFDLLIFPIMLDHDASAAHIMQLNQAIFDVHRWINQTKTLCCVLGDIAILHKHTIPSLQILYQCFSQQYAPEKQTHMVWNRSPKMRAQSRLYSALRKSGLCPFIDYPAKTNMIVELALVEEQKKLAILIQDNMYNKIDEKLYKIILRQSGWETLQLTIDDIQNRLSYCIQRIQACIPLL